MKTITIPVTEYRYDGTTATTDHVLVLSQSLKRFGIGGVPAGQSGRKITQGPLVPGPWAYTFGRASVLAANPDHGTYGEIQRNLAAGREHTVEEGDQIVFDGVTYAIRVTDGFGKPRAQAPAYRDYDFISLVAVDGPTQQTCAPCAGKGWTVNGYRHDTCSRCEGRGFLVSTEFMATPQGPVSLRSAGTAADYGTDGGFPEDERDDSADPRHLAEDYPGQHIDGPDDARPDHDTRHREGGEPETLDGLTYETRTEADWKRLPVKACGCGQNFRQETANQTFCRDCASTHETLERLEPASARADWAARIALGAVVPADVAGLGTVPAAACPRCGGWTGHGGMSQHATATTPVLGRVGCTCTLDDEPSGYKPEAAVLYDGTPASGSIRRSGHARTDAGREVPHLLTVITARLDGAHDAADWKLIAKQLRAAARLADKAAKGGQ